MDAQFIFGDFVENGDGIVEQVLPAAGGKLVKQVLRLLIPRPPEVPGQFIQAGNQFVQFSCC